jgi:hypothetical protein
LRTVPAAIYLLQPYRKVSFSCVGVLPGGAVRAEMYIALEFALAAMALVACVVSGLVFGVCCCERRDHRMVGTR